MRRKHIYNIYIKRTFKTGTKSSFEFMFSCLNSERLFYSKKTGVNYSFKAFYYTNKIKKSLYNEQDPNYSETFRKSL